MVLRVILYIILHIILKKNQNTRDGNRNIRDGLQEHTGARGGSRVWSGLSESGTRTALGAMRANTIGAIPIPAPL